MLLRD
jgi:hypothetical protein